MRNARDAFSSRKFSEGARYDAFAIGHKIVHCKIDAHTHSRLCWKQQHYHTFLQQHSTTHNRNPSL